MGYEVMERGVEEQVQTVMDEEVGGMMADETEEEEVDNETEDEVEEEVAGMIALRRWRKWTR